MQLIYSSKGDVDMGGHIILKVKTALNRERESYYCCTRHARRPFNLLLNINVRFYLLLFISFDNVDDFVKGEAEGFSA